jgi:ribosomal protein S18 acetylase RimI-like enzyme
MEELPIRLRSYRRDDLNTLFEIDQACFPQGVSYAREELAGFISHPDSMTWVAEAGKAIVGFLVANREPKQVGHIITIDVVEPWRRRRVGSLLMDAAEHWARRLRLRFVYLETATDNLAARRFYRTRGYERVNQVDNYYQTGQAAWIMVKWLK